MAKVFSAVIAALLALPLSAGAQCPTILLNAGSWVVTVGGDTVSQHVTQHEAVARAVTEKLRQPAMAVAFGTPETRVEGCAIVPPDTVVVVQIDTVTVVQVDTVIVRDTVFLPAPDTTTPPPPPPPVDQPPVAAFTATCVALTCTLDGSGSSDDGSIVSYKYNLGRFPDPEALGVVVQVTYPHTGERVVSLTVTDNAGQTDSTMRVILLVDSIAPPPPDPVDSTAITVDLASRFQTMDGFGTTERLLDDPHLTDTWNPATQRGAVVVPVADQSAMMDSLYLGLGLTRVRYATEQGVEFTNDNADPTVVNEAGFNYAWKRLDGHADYVGAARARGVTTWWGSPIVAEPWMGSGDVPEYVEYVMQVLRRWRALGQELPLWSLANEPGGAGNRSPEFHRLAIRALGPAMAAEGMVTRIVLADDDKPRNALAVASVVLADSVARSYVTAVATHLYPFGGPQTLPEYDGLAELSALAASHNLPLWMTEWSNTNYLRWAITMHELIALYGVSAVDYMWGVFGQWDFAQLLVVNHTGDTYTGFTRRPILGAFGQWTRHVRPGMTRVAASGPAGLLVTAYQGQGQVVVVVVNPGAVTTVSLTCPGCGVLGAITRSSASEISVPVPVTSTPTFPAGSVTTLVYDGGI